MQKETGKRTVGEGSEQQKISEKACYIVGAGSFEKLDSLPQEGRSCNRGGWRLCVSETAWNQPDVLLGDFDSLEYVPEHDHILRHSPIKDDTDMALAAFYAQEKGYRLFYLYGGLGGKRLDHTMANFQLLTGLSRAGMKAYLIGENNIVTAITGELDFVCKRGRRHDFCVQHDRCIDGNLGKGTKIYTG